MTEYPDKEEQYLLRVQDKNVAQRLRDLLRAPADPDGDKKPAPIELRFSSQSSYGVQNLGSLQSCGNVGCRGLIWAIWPVRKNARHGMA